MDAVFLTEDMETTRLVLSNYHRLQDYKWRILITLLFFNTKLKNEKLLFTSIVFLPNATVEVKSLCGVVSKTHSEKKSEKYTLLWE